MDDSAAFDVVIAPRGYWAGAISQGAALDIIDLDGQQCCDLVCFNADDVRERLSTHATIMRNATIYPSARDGLYSDRQRRLFTIEQDDVGPGGHDLLAGKCSQASNYLKFGLQATPNCTANLVAALAPWGIGASEIGDSFNIFMRLNLSSDGKVSIDEPRSAAGDKLVLRAELDCLVAVSNCPQEWGPTNAHTPSRIGLRASPP